MPREPAVGHAGPDQHRKVQAQGSIHRIPPARSRSRTSGRNKSSRLRNQDRIQVKTKKMFCFTNEENFILN